MATKYTDEQELFIRDNQSGITRQALANLFNAKFGTNATADHMRWYCGRRGWKNGICGKFKKGAPNWCKGLAGTGRVKAPPKCFKKGHTVRPKMPIGYEYVNSSSGLVYVKVAEGKYRQKQIMVWESVNGKIPKGYRLRFLDGNKQNCSIDNLIAVPMHVAMQTKLTDNPQLNKAILLNEHIKNILAKEERGVSNEID